MDDLDQSRKQKNEMIILSVIFGAFFCICILLLGAALVIYTRNFNAFSANPNFFIPATSTPTPTTCPKVPTGWTLEINETFDNNKKSWSVGLRYHDFGRTRPEIVNGQYKIQATASRSVNSYFHPLMNYKTYDFYSQAEVRQVEGPLDSLYGIIFRLNFDRDRYFFGIQDNQRFTFRERYGDEWSTLIPTTYSSAIKPGEPNQLTVLAQDSHFSFCINQLLVAEIENEDIEFGIAGFSYTLFNEGDEAEFEFDNFRLYVPPSE